MIECGEDAIGVQAENGRFFALVANEPMCAALRQPVLKDVFAGRLGLVPQDPNDEPAADLFARIKEAAVAPVQRAQTKRRQKAKT